MEMALERPGNLARRHAPPREASVGMVRSMERETPNKQFFVPE